MITPSVSGLNHPDGSRMMGSAKRLEKSNERRNKMPYKNPEDRNYKRDYQMQLKRGEGPARAERQRARRALDKAGVDRTGKDIEHITPLSKGGTNSKKNLRLESPHDNRSFYRNSDHSVKKNVSRPKGKA
jgi:hypothetical protein